MMSVAEIKEELSKMKTPYVGINQQKKKNRGFLFICQGVRNWRNNS